MTQPDDAPVGPRGEKVQKANAPIGICPFKGKHQCGNIIGQSQAMKQIHNAISMVSVSNASVLIQGESGTGKELVARAIHCYSQRTFHPFVTINCSVFSESLLESELFGHAKGAFTGAMTERVGRFEAADGGTVFLDEIGELTPYMQVKLLRVLQEKEFERVGEIEKRQVDIRVLAATNRDLRTMVEQGTFREDLYYRLKVFPINMPPLRKRKKDIPAIVDHVIKIQNREGGKKLTGIKESALKLFMDYPWPGNVRELRNAIEYAFVVCQDQHIGITDIPQEIKSFECNSLPRKNTFGDPAPPAQKVLTPELLFDLLKTCDWNKAEVGRRLGLSRTTIWTYMKKWNIPLKRIDLSGDCLYGEK
nr:sigma-54 dependent transcriptional regulator [uncultured Desulfobacter sp.]